MMMIDGEKDEGDDEILDEKISKHLKGHSAPRVGDSFGPHFLGKLLVTVLDQSVTFVWILIRTNIRIYSCQENDMNEYPNIFV